MWKSLLKQIWNRRRSNTWIAIELLLVFCLTWYIVDFLFVYNYNVHIPNYRDVNHTLRINLAELPEEHPEYRPEESEGEALVSNYKRILQIIGDYPGVEAIGISYGGASPGSGSYWGIGLKMLNDTTAEKGGQRITIDPDYDFFRVFRNSSGNGEKAVSTKDFEWAVANGIVVGRCIEETLSPGKSILNKELETTYDPVTQYTVIGVVDDIKRFDYERPQGSVYIARPLAEDNVRNAEISIRHNASLSTRVFRDKFKEEVGSKLRIGNYYLLSVIPYTAIADKTKQGFGVTNDIKLRLYMMLFFLFNTMLCVLGTFWYRINQRPNEIGLRKATGADSANIRNSLLLESLFLLLLIVIPAMIIEFQFIHLDLIKTPGRPYDSINPQYLPDRTLPRFLITNLITLVFMSFIVLVATWLPARKGSSLAPAEALRHE